MKAVALVFTTIYAALHVFSITTQTALLFWHLLTLALVRLRCRLCIRAVFRLALVLVSLKVRVGEDSSCNKHKRENGLDENLSH